MITITKIEITSDRLRFKIYCNVTNSSTVSNVYVDILTNKSNILSTDDLNHSFNFTGSEINATDIDASNFYITILASSLNVTEINQLYIAGLKLNDGSIVSYIVTDLYELYLLKLEILRNINTNGAFDISYKRYSKLILKENIFLSAKTNNDINTALNIYQEILNI